MNISRAFEEMMILLNEADEVAVARQDVPAGMRLVTPDEHIIEVRREIPAGHKMALHRIQPGEAIHRYGQRIGQASQPIEAGDWVHSHNLEVGEIGRQLTWRVVAPAQVQPTGRTFLGFHRADGQVGTRNFIAVISTVNCAASVAGRIAAYFTPERLAAYPNVDGVAPVLHSSGCSVAPDSLSLLYLRRTLDNLAHNPNVGGVVFVGLGCEVNQLEGCLPVFSPAEITRLAGPGLVIQEQGGFSSTVRAGIGAVENLLAEVNRFQREPAPLSGLKLALQCGGSDSWSGVTANPLLGRVVDRLVKEGGSAVLGETTEIFGAEQLLLGRVVSDAVGAKLVERIEWWLEYARRHAFSIDNNPTPGNKAGGLTTIFEKSLGAVAKGGSSPLAGVYEYAERVRATGLSIMDTPGNDPVSVTGQLAGGCNVVLFTTGRGSVFGSNLAPCIKIASNSALYRRMAEDMDFDAGRVLAHRRDAWATAESDLFDMIVAVASGKKTASEEYFPRENEFVPWQPDAVL